MSSLVLDTHTLLWHLAGSDRLSADADRAIKNAVFNGGRLVVSAISLAEILYLEEKHRLVAGTFSSVESKVFQAGTAFEEAPITSATVLAMQLIPRDVVPDLPDRIIAATAKQLNLPLITADHRYASFQCR